MSIKLARAILFLGLITLSIIQNFRLMSRNSYTIIAVIYMILCICEIVWERKKRKNDSGS